jgi:hypothetical protein
VHVVLVPLVGAVGVRRPARASRPALPVHHDLHHQQQDPGPDEDEPEVEQVDVLLHLGRRPDGERDDAAEGHQDDRGADRGPADGRLWT